MVGEYDRAVEHLSMAQAADPHSADYAIHLGQAQLQLGHMLEAKASLLRAAQLDPDRSNTWGMLAEIAMRENAAELALQHIEKARRLAPSVTAWRVIEARARKRLNDPSGALGVLFEVSDAERRDPAIIKLMSECHGMLREPEKALRLYAAAIVRSPEDANLLFDGALWAERAGEIDQAIDWAQRAAAGGHPAASNVAARLRHTRGG
jgi:tetratricopeptide (TPR) repeat protein